MDQEWQTSGVSHEPVSKRLPVPRLVGVVRVRCGEETWRNNEQEETDI